MKSAVSTHWLVSLIGFKEVEYSLVDDGVKITSQSGEHTLSWDKIAEPPIVIKGWFFNSLRIGRYSFAWLPKKESQAFHIAILKSWYLYQLEPLKKFQDKVVRYTQKNYLRSSIFPSLQQKAQLLKQQYKKSPPQHLLSPEDEAAFFFVELLVSNGEKFLRSRRHLFIRNETTRYKDFFDNVESDALTDKQREACITDNDNNLVLAGAGTGKTSTMVGKAGYLVASGKAKPDEILMLAFGNKAAKELQERINERLQNPAITASTFHSLGLSIIASVEQQKPRVSNLALDQEKRDKYIDNCLTELLKQSKFQRKAVAYFEQYMYPDANPFDFSSLGEYWEYLEKNGVVSLKGDKVKSHGELLIANFLFTHGIEYTYEAKYKFPTKTIEFSQYKPDFYLDEYDIYLEHYGTDRDGNTAPYIDRAKYQASIDWKRITHEKNDTVCLETFHYQKQEGILIDSLVEQLEAHNVSINPIPEDLLLDAIKELGKVSVLSKLLADLLMNIKNRCSSQEEAIEIAQQATDSRRAMAALDLVIPIWDQYEEELGVEEEIDFNDMLHKAIGYVEDGQYQPRWKYILIDEFQDIASSRANLVKAIKTRVKGCVLFCVGDDWQSIYRFTGSDLNYTTYFEESFGAYSLIKLDKTYRFNNSICDVATRFVMKNPIQQEKELETHKKVTVSAVSVLKGSNSCDPIHIDKALHAISQRVTEKASVYIISRYNFLIDEDIISKFNFNYPMLDIQALSMHISKGKQADYVIVIGLESGKHGFPSEKITHPLLELYLPPEEQYPHAEERRLMYVAITRAKKRVYLITDMEKPSVFMKDDLLVHDEYELCLDEFETPKEQEVIEGRICPSCKSGQLVKRLNKETGISFMGCTNYSRCDYTESCCSQCGGLMKKQGRFNICIDCGWKDAKCPKCLTGVMRKTKTNHWGCSNYRGKDKHPSCGHQETYIDFK